MAQAAERQAAAEGAAAVEVGALISEESNVLGPVTLERDSDTVARGVV